MELSHPVCEFLDGVHFAVVATIGADGLPHQTVMWYERQGNDLVLSTPRGSLKDKHLRRDPRISVCIEQGYRYLTLVGQVTMINDPEQAAADYARLGARYRDTFGAFLSTMPRQDQGQAPSDQDQSRRNRIFQDRISLRLTIERLYGNELDSLLK